MGNTETTKRTGWQVLTWDKSTFHIVINFKNGHILELTQCIIFIGKSIDNIDDINN